MRETFVKFVASIFGIDLCESLGINERISALEAHVIEKGAEIEKMQEIMSMLIMTNPQIRILGAPTDEEFLTSGSLTGPDGRLVN